METDTKTALAEVVDRHFTASPDRLCALLVARAEHFELAAGQLGALLAGEALLAAEDALRAVAREGDRYGRTGGTAFALLCADLGAPQDGLNRAGELRRALRECVPTIAFRVGAAFFPDEGRDFGTLYRLALPEGGEPAALPDAEELELVPFALEAMSAAADPAAALPLLLRHIGRRMELEYAAVFDSGGAEPLCYWSRSGEVPVPAPAGPGQAQCAIRERGTPAGALCCSRAREWTGGELAALRSLAAVIETHLFHLREEDRLRDSLRQIEASTSTDRMTGLMSYQRFVPVARRLLEEGGTSYVLLYCNFDKFQRINDTFGFETGDRVLASFAQAVRPLFGPREPVCRFSADRFLALVEGQEGEAMHQRLRGLDSRLREWSRTQFPSVPLRVTVGYCAAGPGETDLNALIDRANRARGSVRGGHGERRWAVYDDEMRERALLRAELEGRMEAALEGQEFQVWFQPKVDLRTERVAGAEALVRWMRGGTLLQPRDFLDLFEQNGFLRKVDFFVYEQVFRQMQAWLDEDGLAVPISVNVSRAQAGDGGFLPRLRGLVEEYRVAPELIELELPDGDAEEMARLSDEARAMGFPVLLDRFGSDDAMSLYQLRRVEADGIKLDRRFLEAAARAPHEAMVLRAIVQMVSRMAMTAEAVGVETAAQAALLREAGCAFAQGFLYAAPMPAEEFREILLKQRF